MTRKFSHRSENNLTGVNGDLVTLARTALSGFIRYLKGKSSLMLYEQFGDMKFKYSNREFWCHGYYVDTVGKNTAKKQDYIKHQREEDKMGSSYLSRIRAAPLRAVSNEV